MITGVIVLAMISVAMLTVLYDQRTKQDGLTLVILWLSKALFALANGWARLRLGLVAAAGSALRETRTAWKEAI